jgi:hypothetical protein
MIVFVDERAEDVAALRDAFLRLRVHTACVTPRTVAHIGRYPAQAVLIAAPERIEKLEIITAEIRECFPNLPLAILCKREDSCYYRYISLCDSVIDADSFTPREVGEMLRRMYEERTGKSTESIMCGDVRTMLDCPYISVYLQRFDVTPTQWLILRYLQLKHPDAVTAEELLDTCFSHTRKPTHANVRTQICTINKGLRELLYFIPIEYRTDKGYVLCHKRAFPS